MSARIPLGADAELNLPHTEHTKQAIERILSMQLSSTNNVIVDLTGMQQAMQQAGSIDHHKAPSVLRCDSHSTLNVPRHVGVII